MSFAIPPDLTITLGLLTALENHFGRENDHDLTPRNILELDPKVFEDEGIHGQLLGLQENLRRCAENPLFQMDLRFMVYTALERLGCTTLEEAREVIPALIGKGTHPKVAGPLGDYYTRHLEQLLELEAVQ